MTAPTYEKPTETESALSAATTKNRAVLASSLNPAERKKADQDEMQGWIDKQVYDVIDEKIARKQCREHKATIIDSRFVYAIKAPSPEYPNGRVKARCVARGFQDRRIDIDSNSPTASSDSRRTFISIALALGLSISIADIKQAYLNADLLGITSVYLKPPPGYGKPGKLWKLRKAVYGLSDAGTAWYECISHRLLANGWTKMIEDPCIYRRGNQLAALYVDDMMTAAKSPEESLKCITDLHFNLGKGRSLQTNDDFAGVQIIFDGKDTRTTQSITLSQEKYATEEVKDPSWARKAATPLPVTTLPREREKENKLDATGHHSYRSVVGKIMWLATTTRPDLSYTASYLARGLASPSDRDFELADRCSRYIKDTADLVLIYPKINWDQAELTVVSDAAFAAPRDDFRSQSGHLILLHDKNNANLVQWKSATQTVKSANSSMAAECIAAKPAWILGIYLRNLIKGMTGKFLKLNFAIDNDDLYKAVKLRKRAIPKDRSLTLTVHQLRESADEDGVTVKFTPGKVNIADGLTKPLPNYDNLKKVMQGQIADLGTEVDPLAPKREATTRQ
jgi:hypothetical protein